MIMVAACRAATNGHRADRNIVMLSVLARVMQRLRLDPFLAALFASIGLAAIVPVSGTMATALRLITDIAIGLLFFLHGARLSRDAIQAGFTNWRLQFLVLAITFLAFPVLGFSLKASMPHLLPAPLWTGILFLCLLPSTVQSSIAFVALARGSVAAAVCAASLSNMLGIFLTPLFAAVLLDTGSGDISGAQMLKIVGQLLVPFVAGHMLRPWIASWVARHPRLVMLNDRGAILLAVYTAFSATMVGQAWSLIPSSAIIALFGLTLLLLVLVIGVALTAARMAGMNSADTSAVLFCGSQKTLAGGIPMANVLFPAASAGLVVLPLMIFHQIQLVAAAVLARRIAARQPAA